jgi:hypothetical protein
MTEHDYRHAFERAKFDYDRAVTRKQKAEAEAVAASREVISLRRAVVALAGLCGESNYEETLGLTDAVRMVFSANPGPFTLPQIKDAMEGLGVSFADLVNPDASVLSVLNRLSAAKRLMTMPKIEKEVTGRNTVRKAWKRIE